MESLKHAAEGRLYGVIGSAGARVERPTERCSDSAMEIPSVVPGQEGVDAHAGPCLFETGMPSLMLVVSPDESGDAVHP